MPRGAPRAGPAEHPAGSEPAAAGANDELAGEDHRQVQCLDRGEDAGATQSSPGPPRPRVLPTQAGFQKGDRLPPGLCASLKGFLGLQWHRETGPPISSINARDSRMAGGEEVPEATLQHSHYLILEPAFDIKHTFHYCLDWVNNELSVLTEGLGRLPSN